MEDSRRVQIRHELLQIASLNAWRAAVQVAELEFCTSRLSVALGAG